MTCAARVLQGEIEQEEAMGISSQLQQEGYVLLCVAHACSDLEIATHKEDEVYERQFGAEKRL
jgi:ferredoxin